MSYPIGAARLLTVVAALVGVLHQPENGSTAKNPGASVQMRLRKPAHRKTIHELAGPFAKMAICAAQKAHVSPRLVAAVIQVENGGNFYRSAVRESSAGAIGVMQLMPTTAWDVLRVNPWNAQENIDGGTRYLARLLREFHGDVRLALMAYNAGPTLVARGYRPRSAVAYAREVMRYSGVAQ
ncbi:transglycosylase, putative [Acidithiobacillus caldus SM-1]|uniref:Transglycosylase, putative n=1 Tax=Acidithiobacillus caldus (strain SM-1) TaxID=990288 RepID=F9ZRV8_ACICS|nr:lytic transglycosylase domain-containing protein [Acidithiobacillus caldus]AEK58742.1 transglycosylase, putative [Acidithiobacillus caldus SM-1]